MEKNKKTIYILLLIIFIGLIVRFWSINYGLPEIKYIDSEKTLGPAKRIAYNILNGKLDIDPKKYQYPTVFINIMAAEFIVYGLYYGFINTLSGKYRTFKEAIQSLYRPPDPGYNYRAVPSVFHLMARVTSALAGTLTILFVFLLGTTTFKDRKIGLVAALFLAFMFGHVKDTTYPMTDATMCLMGTIAAYYIAKISIDDRLKNYILAGAFLGLGISTKYFPILFLIPFSIIIATKCQKQIGNKKFNFNSYKKPLIGLLMIPLFFLIGTPIFLARYNKILGIGGEKGTRKTGVIKELRSQKGGKLGYTQNWYFDLLFCTYPINNEPLSAQSHLNILGAPLLILLILGLYLSLYKVLTNQSQNRWMDIGLTITVILFYIFMAGTGRRKLIRYFYFLYPIYAVIAARFLTETIHFLFNKRKRNHTLPLIIAAIIFVLPTGIRTMRFNFLRSHTDTRLIAGKWFEQNVPFGTKIFMPQFYPPIISSAKYNISFYSGKSMGNFNPTVKLIKQFGIKYIITSSYDTIRFYSPDAIRWKPDLTIRWKKFLRSLDKKTKLIKHYENNTFNKPGPEIKIYEVI